MAAALPAWARIDRGDFLLRRGGIDVLRSVRRVGPTGKAHGVVMTEDMLALARENQPQAGVENVTFSCRYWSSDEEQVPCLGKDAGGFSALCA
jgi:ubiquinone/menaquinone biosynthesis C-methylase UbiE